MAPFLLLYIYPFYSILNKFYIFHKKYYLILCLFSTLLSILNSNIVIINNFIISIFNKGSKSLRLKKQVNKVYPAFFFYFINYCGSYKAISCPSYLHYFFTDNHPWFLCCIAPFRFPPIIFMNNFFLR